MTSWTPTFPISTFLVSIHNGPTVPEPVTPATPPIDKARAIFELMRNHREQGRNKRDMVWQRNLVGCAQNKCERQAIGGWDGHIDPQGYGMNWQVTKWGLKLPGGYSRADDANNIESLAHYGDGSVEGVWEGWMASPGHRAHILGENSFYASQIYVGVGYYYLESSEKKHYWCVLSIGEV
jgi:uncharacterized protein YkwD